MKFDFVLVKKNSHSCARAGVMHTPHGEVLTPVFMPVGTQATVKSLSPRELKELGATLIIANTYHLHLRPGADLVASLGGLHRFMAWERPIMTDSGGFQIFSLAALREVSDEGIVFRSHLDGSEHFFTPEKAIEVQEKLGADIIMCLDECTPNPASYDYEREALERTHHWAERCKEAQTCNCQALFGIVQGGVFPELRAKSVEFLTSLDFPGYAIGGLSVGELKETTRRMVDLTVSLLPEDKPHYLMGVGSPEDLFDYVARGVDIFDCVLPTRLARNGAVLVRTGRLNLRNARFADDPHPIEESCQCYACRHFSRAYLHHLIKSKEILGLRLATLHNLYFMLNLMRQIRQSILDGTFVSLKEEFLAGYEAKEGYRMRRRRRRDNE